MAVGLSPTELGSRVHGVGTGLLPGWCTGGRHTDCGVSWAVRPMRVGICLKEASLRSEPSNFGDAVRL